jgi:hypothetical protein
MVAASTRYPPSSDLSPGERLKDLERNGNSLILQQKSGKSVILSDLSPLRKFGVTVGRRAAGSAGQKDTAAMPGREAN